MMTRQGIALFFTQGVSLKQWMQLGFLDREAAYYRSLGQALGGVTFVTYGGPEDTQAAAGLADIQVLNNRWHRSSRLFSVTAAWRYRNELKKLRLFKTNQLTGSRAAVLAKWLCGGKLVVRGGHIPSLNHARREAGWFKLLRLRLQEGLGLWAADCVLLATSDMVDYVIRVYKIPPDKIQIVPNFIETSVFIPNRDREPEPGLIGFVGRLTPEKNLEALIEAAAGYDRIRLRFIGDGHLRPQLAAQAQKLAVTVEFLGNIPNHELPRYLRQCQVFAYPSLYEGHPKALLEAMACGLPVITTPVPGIDSLITHRNNGYLCANTSAAAIREGLETILDDDLLCQQMAEQARRFVVENFSLEKVLEKELAVYRQLGLLCK